MTFLAHGIGSVRDLPVPAWLFFWGAAVVLVVSFVLLGALWKRPLLARHTGRPLSEAFSRFVLGPVRIVLQAISLLLFGLVFGSALFGDTDPFDNIAPTWIYVIFWLGVPFASVLFGNVWRALSPWRALADGFVWVWERAGREARPLADYQERWGRWPGAVALFSFVALELAYQDPSSPRALALGVALYTYVTLFGFVMFGRDAWSRGGEGFAIAFAYFARMAPLAARDGRIVVRWPLTGLAGAEPVPGSLALIAVMLGSVAFDGFSRASVWQDLLADIEGPYVLEQPTVAELLATGVNLLGLVAFVFGVAGAYWLACAAARSSVNAPRSLVPDFLLSLIPIAFVYLVAHYFSLFVIQGQFAIPLLSDPGGRGWDVIGTAGFEPNLTPFSTNTIWYVQVGSLVAGHVAGLAIAHDRAITIFRDPGVALRSQYAMLALMVLYTVGGLWLLSRG